MRVFVLVLLVLVGVKNVGRVGLGDQLGHQIPLAVHHGHDLTAVQLGPVGRDDGGGGVFGLQQRHGRLDLFFAGGAGAAEDDAGGMADLIVVKLAEVLHIQLDLAHVGHGHKAVEKDGQAFGHALHRAGHIGQLAHARRLDQNAVGVVGFHHLFQRLAEIADQAAADAAGVQLVDLDAGLPHKAAVDADLAEFVLDQHQLLAGEGFLDQLFDERGFAGAQKAGKYVDFGCLFCHDNPSLSLLKK